MSHFSTVKTEITDLEALEKAVSTMGLRLESDTMCRYYYGAKHREHVIKLPGKYDVAVESKGDGAYDLSADFYGGHVEKVIGPGGEILLKQYAIEKLKIEAKKHGYKVYDKGNGSLKIMDPKTTGKAEVTCLPDGKFEIKTSGFKGKSCMKFEAIEKALGRIDSTKKTAEYYAGDNTAKVRLTEWS